MTDSLRTISTRATDQREPADARQHKADSGGYVFTPDDETQLRRFLTFGVAGGTFYVSEKELTRAAAEFITDQARRNGAAMVRIATEISVAGRAPRQQPAIFAIAAVSALGDDGARAAAYDAVPAVCRTGYTLFLFTQYRSQFTGWSRGLRRAVSRWYLERGVDRLAYQLLKYRQREGFDHRRLLQTAHPRPETAARERLFRWALGKTDEPRPEAYRELPGDTYELPLLDDYLELAQLRDTRADITKATTIIGRRHGVSWEMLPDELLNNPDVWAALLDCGVPTGALIRQIPRLTRIRVMESEFYRSLIATQLNDVEQLRRARVHPISILVALSTYQQGHGGFGGTWAPHPGVVDMLDAAFYRSFGAVTPANKSTVVALDVSGSMHMSRIANMPLTPREASAAMAMVTMATEPSYQVIGFTGEGPTHQNHPGWQNYRTQPGCERLTLSPRQRLDDAVKYTRSLKFGPTDCAQPMLWAVRENYAADTFVIYTDNQTWIGSIHPHQALRKYREWAGKDARLIVVGMTGRLDVSIADPADPLSIDVAGFDSAVPQLISDFSRGDLDGGNRRSSDVATVGDQDQ